MESVRKEQEDDVTRLQKVEWLRENWLGASALGITVASLITTIIIGMRTVIMKGAKATMSFANAVKDAIAKLGPWAVGLANLAYTIIKAGASMLTFLEKNLFIVVIAVSYFLWEMYKER